MQVKPAAHESPGPQSSPIPGLAEAIGGELPCGGVVDGVVVGEGGVVGAGFAGAAGSGGPFCGASFCCGGLDTDGALVVSPVAEPDDTDGDVGRHAINKTTAHILSMGRVSHHQTSHASHYPIACRISARSLLPSRYAGTRASMKTIGVDLWGDQVRGVGGNNNVTCLRPSTGPKLRRSFRELFTGAYTSFADRCREVNEPGIALVAVDEITGRSMGLVRLIARVQRHVAAIVGRHDECDLFLHAHARLALRHLAVVLDPVSDWRPGANVRYRVLDLRTTDGFADENDRSLRGLRCEGPGLLSCGGYALFIMPLGDPTDWPVEPNDAWAFLPERVYFDELERSALGSAPRMARPQRVAPAFDNAMTHRSLIIRTHGPRDTTDGSLVESGDIAGTLELIGPRNRGTIRIGHDELRDGVLIGRYARCNNAQLADDPSLSRVHALLLQVDDAILVIDTASLNGTRELNQPKARLIQLQGDTELVLGTATRARWHWVS